MKARSFFFANYLLVPVALAFIGAGSAAYYMSREAETNSYLSAIWAWPYANEHTRQLIRDTMADGKMTRWEAQDIFSAAMDDIHALGVCQSDDPACLDATTEQARERLAAIIKQTGDK
ncbi:hypothetical protein WDX82_005126 [Salmonella enterica]